MKIKIKRFFIWFLSRENVRAFGNHLKDFIYIWIIFLILLLAAWWATTNSGWHGFKIAIGLSIALFTLLFLMKPMNAVLGLMGTGGSIRVFFLTFIIISVLFSGIYFWGFFKNAGISYDINQPHISYNFYENHERIPQPIIDYEPQITQKSTKDSIIRDTIFKEYKIIYQPISYIQTLQNTIMTSLMQEPTDLFAVASTYNAGMETECINTKATLNNEKVIYFQWILIVQILVSWIFFGVFISLLYNKFRYES